MARTPEQLIPWIHGFPSPEGYGPTLGWTWFHVGRVQKSTLEKCMTWGSWKLESPSCSYISDHLGMRRAPPRFLSSQPKHTKTHQNYNQTSWKQSRIFCARGSSRKSTVCVQPLAHVLRWTPATKCKAIQSNLTLQHRVQEMFLWNLMDWWLIVFWNCGSSTSWKLSQPIADHTVLWLYFLYSLISCCLQLVCVQAVTLERLLL